MSGAHLIELLLLVAVGSPAALLAMLSGASLLNQPLKEAFTRRLVGAGMMLAFASTAIALLVYVSLGLGPRTIALGAWFSAGGGGFSVDLLADGMSLAFATLVTAVTGVVGSFSNRYLHREPGYNRYFVLFLAFVTGMLLVALAGSVEVLFAGWELLGISSALLVGFFHERVAPVRNALRVFAVYRVSDAAMLSAAVLVHHAAGSGSLALLLGSARGASAVVLSSLDGTLIGVLLITAVACKSALLPFSGWLPRAMEGPTPSSAVYYGALSVHAGCYLLLRAAPLLEQSPTARVLAGAAGAATALYATLTARVQADVKSGLAFASLTQVGIIVVEIALGLYTLAFAHLIGHALFRLLQFLSAPNVLHDVHELRNAVGDHFAPTGLHLERIFPKWLRRRLYRLALERGYVDALIDRAVVGPFVASARALDRLDRLLCGHWRRPGRAGAAEGPPDPPARNGSG